RERRLRPRPPGAPATAGSREPRHQSVGADPRSRDPRARVSMDLDNDRELSDRVLDEVEQAIVGKRDPLELVFLGFLADGHVLLEDYPGLPQTLGARVFPPGPRVAFRA